MEPTKKITIDKKEIPPTNSAADYFAFCRVFVEKNYKDIIDDIMSVDYKTLHPEKFFSEYIWVVHATGFSSHVVGQIFPKLQKAYGDYESLANKNKDDVVEEVRKIVNNPDKIISVHNCAKLIVNLSFDEFKEKYLTDKKSMQKLPYIGKVTACHLSRNIGKLDEVKPDLHLVRMAKFWGFSSPEEMCKSVKPNDLPLGIVDLILFYGGKTFGTIEMKKEGDR